MKRYYELIILIGVVTAFFVWFARPLVWSASENARIASVFKSTLNFSLIQTALEHRSLRLDFGNYGHLYFNIVLVPLLLLSYIQDISEQQIIVALRLVPVLFAGLSTIAVFVLTWRYFGRFSAWLAVFLFSVVPLHFLESSVVSRPDIPQVFFLIIGIYFCCRLAETGYARWLFTASACAGFAFACKYSGAFLLPILWIIPEIYHVTAQAHNRSVPVLRWQWNAFMVRGLKRVALISGVFLGAFFVTSPFSFAGLSFIKGIYYESQHTASGLYGFQASRDGLLWFQVLCSHDLLDVLILMLSSISFIMVARLVVKNGLQQLLKPAAVMWMWVLGYMGFLILRVNFRAPRYLLPAIPFLIILAVHPLSVLLQQLATSQRRAHFYAAVMLGALVSLELPGSLVRILEFRYNTLNREKESMEIVVGQWLATHYPKSSRILYDYYSYIPASFPDAHATWAGTIQALQTLQPDLVIVNTRIAERYSDAGRGTEFYQGEERFMEYHEYYAALSQEQIGYTRVRDFGDIQVYVKK